MMGKSGCASFLLILLCAGCIFPDREAAFVLKEMETKEENAFPDHPLSLTECLRMATEAEEYSLHRKFIEASAAEEEEKIASAGGKDLRRIILRHAKAKAELAAALGVPPETRFHTMPLEGDWRDVPPENLLKAAMLLSCAAKGIRDPQTLRQKEVALHCAYLDFLSLCEEADYAPGASSPPDLRRRAHLARLALLEMTGEKDFSRFPAIRARLEKEKVRQEKGL